MYGCLNITYKNCNKVALVLKFTHRIFYQKNVFKAFEGNFYAFFDRIFVSLKINLIYCMLLLIRHTIYNR